MYNLSDGRAAPGQKHTADLVLAQFTQKWLVLPLNFTVGGGQKVHYDPVYFFCQLSTYSCLTCLALVCQYCI